MLFGSSEALVEAIPLTENVIAKCNLSAAEVHEYLNKGVPYNWEIYVWAPTLLCSLAIGLNYLRFRG